ncbi:SRPBCC family protein [Euzebya sp.]|uniref:SRPBCC family protein n=1 Tax=Euzebya sp. TaxID=1971409 RepID=UPI0035168A3D
MELEHTFTVPVPPDEAFQVLRDIERIGPCMPGATIESVDGDSFTGSVKVKIGPIKVTYAGEAAYTSVDEASKTAVIEAKGKEQRGQGTATATVTSRLTEAPEGTEVHVVTDLAVTGKPAQFGRGVMEEVGQKLINSFAECLASTLGGEDEEAAEDPAPAAGEGAAAPTAAREAVRPPSAPVDRPRREAEAIDLLDVAGAPVARRAAPVAGVLVLVLFLWWLVRGRRS